MLTEYKFKLDKRGKKHICPQCGKKTFVRFVDQETGEYLPEKYGRCDREVNCQYFQNPYSDGFEKDESMKVMKNMKVQKKVFLSAPLKEPVFIPGEILVNTLTGYDQNTFVQNLLRRVPYPFEAKDIEKVISLYYLGTILEGHRAGAITFPFIDIHNNIRAIQAKNFNEQNHTTATDFLHTILNSNENNWIEAYKQNDLKVSCLFGEHLLNKYPAHPVALVEAPKTAIYGTLYFGLPESNNLIWLAVYNLSSLNLQKCQALKGRDVVLFPDLSKDGKAFELWSNKAKEIESQLPGTRMRVSDLLETMAPDELKAKGGDIADVLIQMDWRKFRPGYIEQSNIWERVQQYKSWEGMKYFPDLEASGYYSELLRILDERRIKYNLNFAE